MSAWFEVSLIPRARPATTLGERVPGNRVNLETDILARHVERLLAFDRGEHDAEPAVPDDEEQRPGSVSFATTEVPAADYTVLTDADLPDPRPSMSTNDLASIEEAVAALQEGRPVIVADDEDRENEGDVILSAELASQEWLAWTVRYTSGYLCAPVRRSGLTGSSCRRW